MAYHVPHIPFSRAIAALDAKQLGWILAHKRQISMNLDFEVGVLELISERDPDHKLEGSAEFAKRVKARGDRREVGG